MNVYISTDVLEEFKKYVKQQNSSMYGLSNCIERAMMLYLDKKDKVQVATIEASHGQKNKAWELKRKIKRSVGRQRGLDPNEVGIISKNELERVIEAEKGMDRRTIIKWMKALENHDCIKILHDGKIDIS